MAFKSPQQNEDHVPRINLYLMDYVYTLFTYVKRVYESEKRLFNWKYCRDILPLSDR